MSETNSRDLAFMGAAIEEARIAAEKGEVAVGAVAVYNGEIIARAHNTKETGKDPTAHAEIILLRRAAESLGSWRLAGVTVYVTLEPCPMCAGAMVLARIDRLVFGAYDPKMGAVRTLFRIADDQRLNHRIDICGGVREGECVQLLKAFFAQLRSKAGNEPGPE